jgi:hypothetical protein
VPPYGGGVRRSGSVLRRSRSAWGSDHDTTCPALSGAPRWSRRQASWASRLISRPSAAAGVRATCAKPSRRPRRGSTPCWSRGRRPGAPCADSADRASEGHRRQVGDLFDAGARVQQQRNRAVAQQVGEVGVVDAGPLGDTGEGAPHVRRLSGGPTVEEKTRSCSSHREPVASVGDLAPPMGAEGFDGAGRQGDRAAPVLGPFHGSTSDPTVRALFHRPAPTPPSQLWPASAAATRRP